MISRSTERHVSVGFQQSHDMRRENARMRAKRYLVRRLQLGKGALT